MDDDGQSLDVTQFGHKAVRLRWRGVWSAVLWSIWIQRNGIVFNEAIPDAASVLDMIIVRSWS